MSKWLDRLAFARSLRSFLLIWLLGGLALALVVISAVMVWRLSEQNIREQDTRLAQALTSLLRQVHERGSAAAAPADIPNVVFRVSAMNGEWLAGDKSLPPCPWSASLPAADSPEFYLSQRGDRLMRVAALRQTAPGAAGAVLQVAAPWSERVASLQQLWRAGWANVVALGAFLAMWSGLCIAVVLRWIESSRRALSEPMGDADEAAVPLELQPVLGRVQGLLQQQQQWVDQQRRFLADASHQLRTPMAVLRTQLQSAIAGDLQPAAALPQMLHTVDRATGLVNQLLSLTKLEQLARRGGLAAIDVRAVARDAVLELSPLIAAKRIDFSLDETELHAPADAAMLGELVRNLLANAIHHVPEGGRVGITLRRDAQQPELIVWDEGPGVDDALRPRLFQPFAASKNGVGLGLSICRQIGEAMGARVELFNRTAGGEVIGVDAVVAWGQGP